MTYSGHRTRFSRYLFETSRGPLSSGTCSKGVAWADKAYSTDVAHSEVECSNAGVCNRLSGVCECFPPFTGAACQRGMARERYATKLTTRTHLHHTNVDSIWTSNHTGVLTEGGKEATSARPCRSYHYVLNQKILLAVYDLRSDQPNMLPSHVERFRLYSSILLHHKVNRR